MKILLAFNDSYAPHASVVIESIIRNTVSKVALIVIYFENDLSIENQQILRGHYEGRLKSFEFCSVKDEMKELFKGINYPESLSVNTFLRLLIPIIMPNEEGLLLYLDCDLIVKGDITELMRVANLGYSVNAVAEHCPSERIKELQAKLYKTEEERIALIQESIQMNKKDLLGMDAASSYFNAGVIIMNLSLWRKDRIHIKVFEYIEKYNVLPCGDQDALNGVINGNFGKLPLAWNVHPYVYNLHESTCRYSKEELREAKENPKIIHFAGRKAWEYIYENKAVKELYWKYRLLTPWPERKEHGRTCRNVIIVNICRPLLKSIKLILGEKNLWYISRIKK